MTAHDLQLLADFLARRDVAELDPAQPCDVLVLCGSAVLASLDVAAAAFHDGVVPRILVSGGVGHSTAYLVRAIGEHPVLRDVDADSRSEAAVFAEILQRHLDVPASALTTEEESTNCGENAEFSVRLLARWSDVRSTVLVQDPTMQRRTHASFDHHLRGGPSMEVVSFAPFVPRVGADGVRPAAWPLDRFTSLALGEVRRLHDDENGYGPRGAGFIDHVEVPEDVLAAYRRLASAG